MECVFKKYRPKEISKQEYFLCKVELLADWVVNGKTAHKKGDIVEACKVVITHVKRHPNIPPYKAIYYLYNNDGSGEDYLKAEKKTGLIFFYLPSKRENKGHGEFMFLKELE